MSSAVVAFGAVSALGEGATAVRSGGLGEVARAAIARDGELTRAGLLRPFAARANVAGDDRATALLERALDACMDDLDVVRPGWRAERVGLVLGTSAGGMRSAERTFASVAAGERVADAEAPTYFGPLARAVRRSGRAFDPCVLVLGACVSSTLAVGLATRWIERGACDVVLAGGFDEVTVFVAAGFEALRATTASPPPNPFRLGRDGMTLGEGAAVLAIARPTGAPALAFVSGFASTSDAHHLTAPDRDGRGLTRAAARALAEAGDPPVDLVSAHATATPLNDAAEYRGLASALGIDRARDVPAHAFKAQIGHALGAAGALETLAAIDALRRRLLPASAGAGPIDPEAPARLLERGISADLRTCLKVSAAFGGANAALVLTTAPATGSPRAPAGTAFVETAVHVHAVPSIESLAAQVSLGVDRLLRADALVHLALAAVARLAAAHGPLSGAAVIVGSALATVETNALFAERIRERGAAAAEPRRFPYTSPNAVCGECAIAFGLTGPAFAVGGGTHAAVEALACGALLVESGDADRAVVVAVDDAGPLSRALGYDALRPGAVAVLLSRRRSSDSRGRVGEIALRRGRSSEAGAPAESAPGDAIGHAALLPLVAGPLPERVVCRAPPDVFASVAFDAL